MKQNAVIFTWKYDEDAESLYTNVLESVPTQVGKSTLKLLKQVKKYLTYENGVFTVTNEPVTAKIKVTKDTHTWIYEQDGETHHKAKCEKCKADLSSTEHDYHYANHECICGKIESGYVGVIDLVVEKESVITQKNIFSKKVTTYKYTIKPKTSGVNVSKIEYSTSGKDTGYTVVDNTTKAFTSETQLSEFYIRVTDSNGCETFWKYETGNVSLISADEVNTSFLTFSSENSFSLGINGQCNVTGLQYSTNPYNKDGWKAFGSVAVKAVLNTSDNKYYVYLRGDNMTGLDNTNLKISVDSNNTLVDCTGNIMSLLDYDNVDSVEMGGLGFSSLFKDCTALRTAPELPATKLSNACYYMMFWGCKSLEKAPNLPAKNLTPTCYELMFYDCTSLKEAPELPAKNLTESCYKEMFAGCTSLKVSKNSSTDACYGLIFQCPKSTVENPVEDMFSGCILMDGVDATPTATNNYYWNDSDTEKDPKCITFSSKDAFTLGLQIGEYTPSLEYSTDKQTWDDFTTDGAEAVYDKEKKRYCIYLRGYNMTGLNSEKQYLSYNEATVIKFECNNDTKIDCIGNIMTLLNYENPNSVNMKKKRIRFTL